MRIPIKATAREPIKHAGLNDFRTPSTIAIAKRSRSIHPVRSAGRDKQIAYELKTKRPAVRHRQRQLTPLLAALTRAPSAIVRGAALSCSMAKPAAFL